MLIQLSSMKGSFGIMVFTFFLYLLYYMWWKSKGFFVGKLREVVQYVFNLFGSKTGELASVSYFW